MIRHMDVGHTHTSLCLAAWHHHQQPLTHPLSLSRTASIPELTSMTNVNDGLLG